MSETITVEYHEPYFHVEGDGVIHGLYTPLEFASLLERGYTVFLEWSSQEAMEIELPRANL